MSMGSLYVYVYIYIYIHRVVLESASSYGHPHFIYRTAAKLKFLS